MALLGTRQSSRLVRQKTDWKYKLIFMPFVGRHWVDCSRCSTFHDQHWQHLDPVSGKVNIFNSSLSESWGLQWFNRCEQSVPGIQIWWSMLLSTTRSYGIGFSQRYSIFFSNRLFLYLHSTIGLLTILWCRIFLPSLLTLSLWSPPSFDGSACSESTWY